MPFSTKKTLQSPVQYLKGVGPALAKILSKMGILTIQDLIFFLPRDYEDRRSIKPIGSLRPSEFEIIKGVVTAKQIDKTKRGFALFRATINDKTAEIEAIWFNQPFLDRVLKVGDEIYVSGKVNYGVMRRGSRPTLEISVKDYEKIESFESSPPIVPIYSLTEGLYQKTIRKIIVRAIAEYGHLIVEPLPKWFLEENRLIGRKEALLKIHQPTELTELEAARHRLVFEELFLFQLGTKIRSQKAKNQTAITLNFTGSHYLDLLAGLPFKLTNEQEKVLGELKADLLSGKPMNRLLMGEVGSGKTILALLVMLAAIDTPAKLADPSGREHYQTAIMAPTEILARQHFHKINYFLEKNGKNNIKTALLIGSVKAKDKQIILKDLEGGKIDLLIGTHALIEDRVKFKNLGLVVIDEQHRFGVMQRETLTQKGYFPHLLFLTATPIPRSLALTLYGDLDVSLLKELPPGRTPVKTHFVTDAKRHSANEFMRQKVVEGSQIYVVCPLIEESEKLDLKAAEEEFLRLKEIFPEFKLALLHGRLKSEDKEAIMADFVAGNTQILVSTTVIEVGVDVPNATIMLIEQAERFGLSQLHQLRGRVGRGQKESFCFLFGEPKTAESKERLKAMIDSNDGFYLAEVDLKLRGPGDYVGTRQAGLPDFRIADIIKHEKVLEAARAAAEAFLKRDPAIKEPDHQELKQEVLDRFGKFLKVERLN